MSNTHKCLKISFFPCSHIKIMHIRLISFFPCSHIKLMHIRLPLMFVDNEWGLTSIVRKDWNPYMTEMRAILAMLATNDSREQSLIVLHSFKQESKNKALENVVIPLIANSGIVCSLCFSFHCDISNIER